MFPGGSVTGAPKISALDHIAALEPVGRGASMGALGRVYPNGDLDLALTIRTFAVAGGRIHLWVGGGIVWDSEPEAEIEESLVKARPLLELVGAPLPTAVHRRRLDGGGQRVEVPALPVPERNREPAGRRRRGRGVVPPDEPVVQADDEALLRGRAAFETLRVYGGKPFRLAGHLARMQSSAERLDIAWPGGFEALAGEALAAAGAEDAVLRLYLTPGRERSGRPVSLALVSALPDDLEERRGRGIKLISLLGVRAEAPWLLGGVKSTSYAVNMAAEAEARARGADDAVFVRDDGVVLEGPVTNVWWRRGTTLYTPSLDLGILAGVTRAVMIEAAPAAGYEIAEGTYPLGEVLSAEEAFTTSSVREVMPVIELDGQAFERGPAAAALQQALREEAGR